MTHTGSNRRVRTCYSFVDIERALRAAKSAQGIDYIVAFGGNARNPCLYAPSAAALAAALEEVRPEFGRGVASKDRIMVWL